MYRGVEDFQDWRWKYNQDVITLAIPGITHFLSYKHGNMHSVPSSLLQNLKECPQVYVRDLNKKLKEVETLERDEERQEKSNLSLMNRV